MRDNLERHEDDLSNGLSSTWPKICPVASTFLLPLTLSIVGLAKQEVTATSHYHVEQCVVDTGTFFGESKLGIQSSYGLSVKKVVDNAERRSKACNNISDSKVAKFTSENLSKKNTKVGARVRKGSVAKQKWGNVTQNERKHRGQTKKGKKWGQARAKGGAPMDRLVGQFEKAWGRLRQAGGSVRRDLALGEVFFNTGIEFILGEERRTMVIGGDRR
ncbi:hypothetical protein H4582DRAFT_2054656 [Lactarius indigo]|nr:hypothetical protein H4582DRAFT_2059255 [Lactarius indigo]KAI9442136.1 hypothetical protein H4582DRAFT_2054656 [Lactarius indigo]